MVSFEMPPIIICDGQKLDYADAHVKVESTMARNPFTGEWQEADRWYLLDAILPDGQHVLTKYWRWEETQVQPWQRQIALWEKRD